MTTCWSVTTLKAAIEEVDGYSCTTGEAAPDVIEVTMAAEGDMVLYVNVGETQILTTAILWPRDEQEDPAAFEAMMLRSHKRLLPLCALSVDDVAGREYYELFGSIAQGSDIGSILTELQTIAESALELARELGPKAA